jgi:hypothetical protein
LSNQESFRQWGELDAAGQERLGEAIGRLLDRGFVLKGSVTAPDTGYRILDHYEEAARSYLRIIGWDLRIDRAAGFVQAVHPEGHGRVRLGKHASLLLCVLRLLYQKRAGAKAWESDVVVSISEIQEAYLLHAGADKPFARHFLETTLRKFQHLGLVGLPRPFDAEPQTVLELLPTLKAALPDSALEQVSARMEEYLQPASAGLENGDQHS